MVQTKLLITTTKNFDKNFSATYNFLLNFYSVRNVRCETGRALLKQKQEQKINTKVDPK